jgi:hypothetical protein
MEWVRHVCHDVDEVNVFLSELTNSQSLAAKVILDRYPNDYWVIVIYPKSKGG